MNGYEDSGREGAPRTGTHRNFWMAALAPAAALASSTSWLALMLVVSTGHAPMLPPGTLAVARALGHVAARLVFSM